MIALPLMRRRGPGISAAIDGVADGGVRGAGAFGAHVALGRKSGEEVVARGECGHDGPLRDGFLHGLQIFRAGMEEEMHVRVNQAGEKCRVAEVNHFRCGRPSDFRADFLYGISLDQDFAWGGDAAGFHVEEAGGMEHDGVRRWRGLRLRRLRVELSVAKECESCG